MGVVRSITRSIVRPIVCRVTESLAAIGRLVNEGDYLLDESGNYLTDESDNRLTG